ncbi:DegT/DnrJ/EryC1/StrS family aminotransferase [Planctomicrobium piriforme]|uniref:dTDP-4-amino-4,6-dideoxygalactose transaminase n=1 Tax=Planctomicrobium piriforme TaxID=1576369 RepID=A0A1I3Q952_9PLAN|nr:DegT/DnrJ/EryC1/StrS family aminotransferase [Planctomicrobium piriforme]SFJ30149.1 dTDP-4-amino-4,6-dideoxygalactose transaminase [Planctomicrobium piriforme]
MTQILPLSRPQDSAAPVPLIDLVAQYQTIRDEVQTAVTRVFERQSFVLGEEVDNFENDISEYCDARHSIGCASGTDALVLGLMALGIGPGDEVITSPYSFFATASCIVRVGARPVFVDIDPVTYNMNPAAVEAAITRKTRAIIPVHLYGQCAEMDPIWRCATKNHLAVIEDACQAIGSVYRGRKAGVLGTMGCFSFFPTKNLGGAGDGGLITTDDRDLAARLKRLRVHGDFGGYNHIEVGLNSRLDALQAAVLAVKLKHLDTWSAARRENADRYRHLMQDAGIADRVELPTEAAEHHHIYNQFIIRVRDGKRDEVLAGLKKQGIGCAIYYPRPLHLQECFSSLQYRAGQLPESELAANETIALPIFAELGAERQARVVQSLKKVLAEVESRHTKTIRRAA